MHSSPDTVSGRLPSVQGRIPSVQGRIRSGAHPRGCLSRWCFFGNITLITRINIYLPRVGPTPAGNYLSRWCFFDNITLLINYKNRSMHLGEGRKAYTWEASTAAKREVSCNALSPAEERRAPGTNWWIKWNIISSINWKSLSYRRVGGRVRFRCGGGSKKLGIQYEMPIRVGRRVGDG